MDVLFQDANKLIKKDIIPYYEEVFEAFLLSLRKLEQWLKIKFSEKWLGQFDQIVKIGIEYWKRVWFRTNFVPELINGIYDMYENYDVDKSHLITNKFISSYYTLGIFNGSTNVINANWNLTPLNYHNFIQWHIEYFSIVNDFVR
uniref:Uncharacterized protein n=1 Tax=Acrobeloides nanus TaxID=290746 RepID=A0A914DHQ8_9BILA